MGIYGAVISHVNVGGREIVKHRAQSVGECVSSQVECVIEVQWLKASTQSVDRRYKESERPIGSTTHAARAPSSNLDTHPRLTLSISSRDVT